MSKMKGACRRTMHRVAVVSLTVLLCFHGAHAKTADAANTCFQFSFSGVWQLSCWRCEACANSLLCLLVIETQSKPDHQVPLRATCQDSVGRRRKRGRKGEVLAQFESECQALLLLHPRNEVCGREGLYFNYRRRGKN